MLSFQKEHGSGEGFKGCKRVALQIDVWNRIPSLGGGGSQEVDIEWNVEAGNRGRLHWQSVGEGDDGWLC